METIKYADNMDWRAVLQRPAADSDSLNKKVRKILDAVKKKGDKAVRKFSETFDGVRLADFAVHEFEFTEADKLISDDLKHAIAMAKGNIERFHGSQMQSDAIIETMPGVCCWRRNSAIEKVGLYIPGGSAPLFSTLLMLGVPARMAGCGRIVVCTPPDKKGGLHPAILYTANLLGITEIYKIGGVQAIGAMAYGTKNVPAVFKIFGPGNQFITRAKQQVQQDGVAIDMPAGPSEVAVFADQSANNCFVAADLLSQAEHGIDSQVILVTNSRNQWRGIEKEIRKQLDNLPRKPIIKKVLERSRVIFVKNDSEAISLLNAYAPEHLILNCKNAVQLADLVVNAGSVFLGNYSPESAGDYATGPNHTLPTNGYARSFSGVSVESFVKKITFQQISREGLTSIAKTVEAMAGAEGLEAHANAIRVRVLADDPQTV
jgi:histidinol dehydrogenase